MNPKVSVIIPVYNAENYLRQCIDSILKQTLREIEIIAVDDGSTDRSPAMLDEYARKDARLRVIHKPNTGYGHSMNIGMDEAAGEYVAIVESDDFIKPAMYQALYALAVREDVDFIKSDFYRAYAEGRKMTYLLNRLSADPSFYGRVIDPGVEPDVLKLKMNTWCGIYRRSFLNEHKIRHNETPGASYQDNGFWFQTHYFAKRVYYHDRAYYVNRRDNPNSSVYSKEKVYAMCDEFEFISRILESSPERKQQVLPYIFLRKLHNYEMTLNRIDERYVPDFLAQFREEFLIARDSGRLISDVFTEEEWAREEKLIEGAQSYLHALQVANLERQLHAAREELSAIKNSLSFKIGRMVTAPLRLLRDAKDDLPGD